ncbi:hypothetical protein [Paraburkholderia sacchari]|uniref:hypothetical protein n=1 Tax=Paraburkholderia sacchari TaxID=159450 RepID=UPI000543C025|nr:hypothetical protein [Paraburkholderia sacchari]NLP65510.1 hypothetical protein [Paraburkholderia sacchari]NLP65595.1 hypothetical protein [Paraburkholderia sacchari]
MFKESSSSSFSVLGSRVFAEEGGYVPPAERVVAPEVLAKVFADGPLPFPTNADGSVELATYMQWLTATWDAGIAAFGEMSEIETPLVAPATT